MNEIAQEFATLSGQKRKDKKERQKARKAQARAAGQLQHALALEFAIRMSHIHTLSGDGEVDEHQEEEEEEEQSGGGAEAASGSQRKGRGKRWNKSQRTRSKIREDNRKLQQENLLLMQELIKVREERDNAKQAAKEHADHVIGQKDKELLMAQASHNLYVEGQTEKVRKLNLEHEQSRKKLKEEQEERIKKLKEDHQADMAQLKAKHADEMQLRDAEQKRKLQFDREFYQQQLNLFKKESDGKVTAMDLEGKLQATKAAMTARNEEIESTNEWKVRAWVAEAALKDSKEAAEKPSKKRKKE